MRHPSVSVSQLTQNILDEIFLAFGAKAGGWPRKVLWPAFWLPAHRFARLAANFDGIVARSGFPEAARWLLADFTVGYKARGVENLPCSGPLLIVSNHPGAFDALVIVANIPREDVKIIVSGVPFLRSLAGLKEHFIYSTENTQVRMMALRSALRHLQAGGAVLLFATGLVDPDPAFLPGAEQALQRWSNSLEVFLRKMPEAQVITSIVSGVLAPQCMRFPQVWLRKMEDWQCQRAAEYIQEIQQLAFGRKFGLAPQVTFGEVIPKEALSEATGSNGAREAIVDYAQNTLASHLDWIRSRQAK